MSSSKFATPFFKKSPLHGAYSSGAGGIVPVSYADVHSKFQDDIAKNVAKSYSKDNDPCSDPNTVQYTKDSVLKKCPKKTENNTNGVNNSKPAINNVQAARDAAQSIIDGAIYSNMQEVSEKYNLNIPVKGQSSKVKIKI
jgi:hypothetical protein